MQGAGLEASWHKMPTRHLGTDPRAEYVNLLLLPWPLRVRESDFRAVEGSVQRVERDPFGFFEFAPAERLDLDLVDRVLTAALDEVDDVDVVVLPESAVDESEIDELEAVLDRQARPGAAWRSELGLAEPSPQLGEAIESLNERMQAAAQTGGTPTFDTVLAAAYEDRSEAQTLGNLVGSVLRSTLEQLRSRQADARNS